MSDARTRHENELLKAAKKKTDVEFEDDKQEVELPPMQRVIVIDRAHWLCPFCKREVSARHGQCGARRQEGCGAIRKQWGAIDFAYKIGQGRQADSGLMDEMKKEWVRLYGKR